MPDLCEFLTSDRVEALLMNTLVSVTLSSLAHDLRLTIPSIAVLKYVE